MSEKKGLMDAAVNRWSEAQERKTKQQLWEEMVYDPALWGDDIDTPSEETHSDEVGNVAVNHSSDEQERKTKQQLWEEIVYDPALWGEDVDTPSEETHSDEVSNAAVYCSADEQELKRKQSGKDVLYDSSLWDADIELSIEETSSDESSHPADTGNNTDVSASDEKNKINLVKVTARINEAVHDVMKDIAEEYNVSFSEVVRLSIDGHLEKYLGTIQYIDKSQGKEIIQKCTQLANEMQGIQNELHRIGVNVNQMSKCNNFAGQIKQLYEAHFQEPDRKKKMEIYKRIQELETTQRLINFEKVDYAEIVSCMKLYEQVSREVAGALWHIQG